MYAHRNPITSTFDIMFFVNMRNTPGNLYKHLKIYRDPATGNNARASHLSSTTLLFLSPPRAVFAAPLTVHTGKSIASVSLSALESVRRGHPRQQQARESTIKPAGAVPARISKSI